MCVCVAHNSVFDRHTAEPAFGGSTAVSTDAQQFPRQNTAAVRVLRMSAVYNILYLRQELAPRSFATSSCSPLTLDTCFFS